MRVAVDAEPERTRHSLRDQLRRGKRRQVHKDDGGISGYLRVSLGAAFCVVSFAEFGADGARSMQEKISTVPRPEVR